MSFKLPDLSYDYNALEPYIDGRTMEIHHSKHHAAYTANLNKAVEGTSMEGSSIEDIFAGISAHPVAVRNNGGGYGGGLASEYSGSTPMIINCTFSDNEDSGVFSAYSGSFPKVADCTFTGNVSGAIRCSWRMAKVSLTNCILWGNEPNEIILDGDDVLVTASYCDIRGGWAGKGNVDIDPSFGDVNNGDFHLKSETGRYDPNSRTWVTDDVTSPCIDAGDPRTPIGLESFPNGGRINMGAYGGTTQASKAYFGGPPCETIVAGDVNGDCKVDFLDFSIMALHRPEEH